VSVLEVSAPRGKVGLVTVRTSTESDGFERIVIENERVSVTMVPALGAKIASLFDRLVEREWMAPPARPYRYAEPGDSFADHDSSGWDECFPNIAPGVYPASGGEMAPPLLDHGELWSQSWMVELGDDAVSAAVSGFHFPYLFERRLRLEGDRVFLDYQVRNTGNRSFRCLWAAHPLFAPEPGMRIMVPVTTVYSNEAPRTREQYEWPVATMADGARDDLSVFGGRSQFELKLFTGKGAVRRAALADASAAAAWIGMDFDPKLCPHLGLWLNEGGWPPGGAPLRHVALEPTSSRADQLDLAMKIGDTWLLEPGKPRRWSVGLVLGRGRSSLAAFIEDGAARGR
jgi:galactose mutarotase-like enzyme